MLPALVVLLVAGLSALPALALASPPDPLWIGGLFDAGDSDDAVLAATSTQGATDRAPLDAGRTLWLALGAVQPPASIAPAGSALPVFQGRAPPLA